MSEPTEEELEAAAAWRRENFPGISDEAKAIYGGPAPREADWKDTYGAAYLSQRPSPPQVGKTGAAKVLEDLEFLRNCTLLLEAHVENLIERVADLEDHLAQLHSIVHHQAHRLDLLDGGREHSPTTWHEALPKQEWPDGR